MIQWVCGIALCTLHILCWEYKSEARERQCNKINKPTTFFRRSRWEKLFAFQITEVTENWAIWELTILFELKGNRQLTGLVVGLFDSRLLSHFLLVCNAWAFEIERDWVKFPQQLLYEIDVIYWLGLVYWKEFYGWVVM